MNAAAGEHVEHAQNAAGLDTLFLAFLAVGACSAFATAQAQQASGRSDDVQNGHYLAVLICSNCHVASPDQSIEPVLQPPAPSLESIAKSSTTSSDTIRAFLATTHRDISNPAGMPNPELLDFQTRQVVAYVLSLRKPSAAALGRASRLRRRKDLVALKSRVWNWCSVEHARAGSLWETRTNPLPHASPSAQCLIRGAGSECGGTTVEAALALARKLVSESLDAEVPQCSRKLSHRLARVDWKMGAAKRADRLPIRRA